MASSWIFQTVKWITILTIASNWSLSIILYTKWSIQSGLQHIEAETKWPLFRRRHFQMHFAWMKMHEFLLRLHWNFVPKVRVNNNPALVQKMVWRQATSHYLNQLWLDDWGVTPPQWINSSPPSAAYMRQWTVSVLVQIMACRRFDAKPLTEPTLTYC